VPDADVDQLEVLGAEVTIETGKLLWETNDLPDILCYDTDATGAVGIVRGRALWATHAYFMNDASELRVAYPRRQEALRCRTARPGKRVISEPRRAARHSPVTAILPASVSDAIDHYLPLNAGFTVRTSTLENADHLSLWGNFALFCGYAAGPWVPPR
jgi:hypothetical protein